MQTASEIRFSKSWTVISRESLFVVERNPNAAVRFAVPRFRGRTLNLQNPDEGNSQNRRRLFSLPLCKVK
jgi:hypothetical protein